MTDLRTILVTTDLSETSKKAFPMARMLAGKFGSKIVLVHVDDLSASLFLGYTEFVAVEVNAIVERQRQDARRQVERLAADELGGGVEPRVAIGTPHLEIVRLAEEIGADLIVMATHGRGFVSHAILGSTTERVVRRAPCPVLVVREVER
jgi:nucleotide-binding universal stress UspA family protein